MERYICKPLNDLSRADAVNEGFKINFTKDYPKNQTNSVYYFFWILIKQSIDFLWKKVPLVTHKKTNSIKKMCPQIFPFAFNPLFWQSIKKVKNIKTKRAFL